MAEKRCYGCMQPKTQSPVCEHCGFNENAVNEPHQLPFGTVLRGQYEVGKVLGQGGFGITYLGRDQYLDMPVAIKEYYPGGLVTRDRANTMSVITCTGGDEQYHSNKARFLREARALARFRDVPQIVHVQNFFEENNTAYIIMEYVRGIDLRRYINMRGGRLTAEETFTILRPVMEALEKVHGAGLVHRDISPDNIMLLPGGNAKLLDFGAVRDVGDAQTDKGLTSSTVAILKQGFAPLEQYQRRGSLGPWTDVYALCATVYYCLTGRVPMDAPERMLAEQDMDWHSVPGLTERQSAALEKGMALLPKNRISSVAELCGELFAESRETVPVRSPEPVTAPETGQEAYPSYTIPLEDPAVTYTAPVDPLPEQMHTVPLETSENTDASPQAPIPAEPVPEETPKQKKKLWIAIAAAAAALVLAFSTIHIWSEPTCDAPSTCLLCGKKSDDAALGHTFAAATCTAARKCTVCGAEEGLALGHDWQEATCTAGKTCSRCDASEGEALGHDWQDATCARPKTCSRCKETSGAALAHTFGAATCTDAKKCTVCGAEEGTALGHNWTEATYDTPKTCSRCNATEGDVKGYVGTVSGSWSSEMFYRSNRRAGNFELSRRLENCRRFTLNYNIVKVNSGNIYGNFEVFVRYGEKEWEWESIGTFKLPNGQNSISVDFELDPGVSFDAISVVCQASGGYSYSDSLSITDVQLYED